jgi:uncharacterized protein YqgC (DUF456 family)
MLKLIGLILPALIDLINSKISESKTRFWVSAAVCAVVGVGVDFITRNGFAGYQGMTLLQASDAVSESVLMIFGLAQLSYKAVWDGVLGGLRDNLGLNAKTNGTV